MATISRIKPNQVLFTVGRRQLGNTKMSCKAFYRIVVLEIDPAGQFVVAAWNGNAPRKYTARQVAAWKVNDPAIAQAAKLAKAKALVSNKIQPSEDA